jgi:alkylhydroperoxidase family enzyme
MRFIEVLLIVAAIAFGTQPVAAQPDKQSTPGRLPASSNEDAWTKLPRENPPLPPWAKVLVGPLPKTTAKMLELDHLQRAKNPLGPELAGLLQWTVADALGSKFGKATAVDDLRRNSIHPRSLEKLGDIKSMAADTRLAAAFARRLTLAGSTITDEEFAELLKVFGPEKVTAIVHTVAYANFFNRIVLGIGADGDTVPPVDVKFDADRLGKVLTPTRPPWDDLKTVSAEGLSIRVEWSSANHDELGAALDKQKERKLRIPLPDASRFKDLPPKEREGAEKILWNTVSSGYQPTMPRAWFAALYTYYDEAKVDRVFTNSMFWVVTRTNDCFY